MALEHGTPLYIYDVSRLRSRIEELRAILRGARAELYFATMANDRPSVLRVIAAKGVGACVNSIPHLELAREAGFPLASVQFTSTGVAPEDMRLLQRLRIRTNLDSLRQLSGWYERAGPGSEAGVRINAASLTGAKTGDRIGIEAEQLEDALAVAARFGGCLTGVHCYVGTNFQHADQMLPILAAFFRAAARVPSLSYVNIGGGIGVDYDHTGVGFDLAHFGEAISEYAGALRERLKRQIKVVFEPGRALTASCATFVTRVTDVKELRGERFVGVDGSVSIFPRPLHHPESPHRVRFVEAAGRPNTSPREARPAVVVGRTTFSRDILGSAALPAELEPGSLLVFDDAGAYCQSMASRFLGQPEPAEAFLGQPLTEQGLARPTAAQNFADPAALAERAGRAAPR